MSAEDLRQALRESVEERRSALEPSAVPWGSLRHRRSRTRRLRVAGAGVALVAAAAAGTLALADLPGGSARQAPSRMTTEDGRVTVPDLVGQSLSQASVTLADAGLRSAARPVVTSDAAPGTVLAQDPAPGSTVDAGAAVGLAVAQQPPQSGVPVLNDSAYEAVYRDVRLVAGGGAGSCPQVFFDLDGPAVNGSPGGSELSYVTPPCNARTVPGLQTGDQPVEPVADAHASAGGCAVALQGALAEEVDLRPGLVLCGRADAERTMVYRLNVVAVQGTRTTVEISAWYVP